jgi:hypothetical protein
MALLAILGLAFWYAYWASPRQERLTPVVGSAAKVGRAGEMQPAVPITDKRRVRLEIMERGVDAFSEPRRDIFRLVQPRPIAAAPKPVIPVAQPAPMTVLSPIPVANPDMLPGSSVRFNVLGFLKKENSKTVFLSLENEIFIVKEGDRFGKNKEFEAEEITDEKLVVRQGSGTFPITVPLLDKNPSQPISSPSPPPSSFTPDGHVPVSVRPPRFRPPPIQDEYNVEEEKEDLEDDVEEDMEILDEPDQEELQPEEENPTEETESGNPAAGNMGSLPMRSMIQ